MTGKNKIKKLISGLLIILIILPTILFSSPKKANAIWISGIDPAAVGPNIAQTGTGAANAASNAASLALKIKDVAIEVGKQLLKAVAKRVLAEMTKSTVNWINSGFHGSPLFLENSDSFFQDIAKSELKNVVDTFGYDSLTYPFGKQFALNAINSYKNQLSDNMGYTLSKVMTSTEANNYRNNFNVGGWNGFLINTQYPQNNYLGSQMQMTDYLASKLQGTSQNAAQRTTSLLQQGMGFLSPQMCPPEINKDYNNGLNEFQRPSFQYDAENVCDDSEMSDEDYNACQESLIANREEAKAEWEKKNNCINPTTGKSALVNTTPGSVVSNQVTKALGMSFDQTALDGALGNSLSMIFDALLNHFLDKGLNALSSTVNPKPVEDDWSYNGQTLGSSPEAGSNSTWDSGPDQPIDLKDFKKMIDDAITSTTTELKLIYNDAPNEPGIYQMYSKIWPKAQELDKCIPGPDVLGLKERIDEGVSKINRKIQDETSGMLNSDKTEEADEVSKELNFAVKLFKDWIDNKMMSELPSSLIYIDAINNVSTLSKEMDQLTNNRMIRNRALVRLQAIKTNLSIFTTQPTPGSGEDKVLVSLWKQYQGANLDISNTNTIENTRNKLSEAKDIYNNLVDSMKTSNTFGCPAERIAKGWSNPGGPNSTFNNGQTEVELFCKLPIKGGYSHPEKNPIFINKNVTYPEIPLVNAKDAFEYETITLKSFAITFASPAAGIFFGQLIVPDFISVNLSCSNIFNASILDYKGNLPGTISTSGSNSQEVLGNCKYNNGVNETNITNEQCTLNGGTWGPLEPLGTCTVPTPTNPPTTTSIPNTTKSDCTAANGTWVAN